MSTHGSPSAGPASGPVKAGELVELDYELWGALPSGQPELIDTTREEVAAKANLKTPEGFAFGARPHLIGGEYFPAGIEKALSQAEVGKEFTREFPPAEAFGERDPKLIELFGMHEISRLPEMRREDANLEVGSQLTINGRRGRVVSLTAARVRVDFNPPFAGRTVRGSFRIVKTIETAAEQVRALLDIHYGRGRDFQVEVKGGTVSIRVPDRSKFDFAWMAAKPRVIERIRAQLKPENIELVEEYATPPPKAAPKEKEREKEKERTPPAPPAGHHRTEGGAAEHSHAHPAGGAPAGKD